MEGASAHGIRSERAARGSVALDRAGSGSPQRSCRDERPAVVVIVEGPAPLREGLRTNALDAPRRGRIGEAPTARRDPLIELDAAVVLMDLRMRWGRHPGDGRIRETWTGSVMVLNTFDDDGMCSALESRRGGYLPQGLASEKWSGRSCGTRGESFCRARDGKVSRRSHRLMGPRTGPDALVITLSPREREILRVATGASTGIAPLVLAEGTVRTRHEILTSRVRGSHEAAAMRSPELGLTERDLLLFDVIADC